MIKVLIPLAISLVAIAFVLYLIYNKNEKKWEKLSESDKKKKMNMISGGLAVFIAGLLTALLLGKNKNPEAGDSTENIV